MDNRQAKESLPQCAAEYIELVAGKIGYGRELSVAFEAALHGLKDEEGKAKKALSIIAQLWKPERLRELILKGRKLCRPLWSKAMTWGLRAAGTVLLCYVAFLFCELLPMSLIVGPELAFLLGSAICLYLVCRYWLERCMRTRLLLCAEQVSEATEAIAETYGTFVIPRVAQDYISLVAGKVGYRCRIRAEVRRELEGHFYDALVGIGDKQMRLDRAAGVVKDFGDAKVLAKLIRRGKKRCRPLWLKAIIRCTQAAGTVFVCLVAFGLWFFSGKPHITVDYVAELNKLVQPVADESLNAMVHYDRALKLAVEEPRGVPYAWQDLGDPNDEGKIRDWVAANAGAIDEVLLGNEKPHCWHTYESGNGALTDMAIPYLTEYRYVFVAMCWKARFAAEAGDMQAAVDWIDATLRFSNMIVDRQFISTQLARIGSVTTVVRVARTMVQNDRLSYHDLELLQRTIERNLAGFDFRLSLANEWLFIDDTIQRIFTSSGHIYPSEAFRVMALLDPNEKMKTDARSWAERHKSLASKTDLWARYYKALLATKEETLRNWRQYDSDTQKVLNMSPYEAHRLGVSPSQPAARAEEPGILAELWGGIWRDIAWQETYRSRAEAEAFPAIVAAHRYKLDKGVWPQNMDELHRTGYIKTIPMDPWSDGPLVYRRTEEGFIIYSLGPNFTDEGGVHVPWPKRKSPSVIYNDPEDFKEDLVYWPMPPEEKRKWY